MGRPILDVNDHKKCLDNRGQKVVRALSEQSQVHRPSMFYLHGQDYNYIKNLMSGSGFDVARGFRFSGIRVKAIEEGDAVPRQMGSPKRELKTTRY